MPNIFKSKDFLYALSLGIFALVIHIPFLLTNLDFNNDAAGYSSNFVMPFFSGNYNVQLPGYILYIYLGKFFNFFFNDPVLVQNFINILLSVFIAVGMYFLLIKIKLGKLESFLFSILFSSLNVVLLGGLTGGCRLFHVLAAILLIYTAYGIFENKNDVLKFSFLFGLFMGFRQDLSFMFGFLLIYTFFMVKDVKLILKSIGIVIAVSLIWFIPLVYEYGGIIPFIAKLNMQFDGAVAPTSVLLNGFSIVPVLNIIRLIFNILNCLFFVFIMYFISRFSKNSPIEKPLLWILLLAFLPSFLFQLFVHNGNFVLLTAFIVPLFIFLIKNFKLTSWRKIVVTIAIIVFVQAQFFAIRVIEKPTQNEKIINTLWLQWSYDGAKSGNLLTFRQVNE